MDASACRVVYIDDRFNTERWITREGFSTPVAPQRKVSEDLNGLPPDLQANVHAVLSVFSQGTRNCVAFPPSVDSMQPYFYVPLLYTTVDPYSLQSLCAALADPSLPNS